MTYRTQRYVAEQINTPIQYPENADLDGPNAHLLLAWFGLFRPELPILKRQTYIDLGYHLNGFNCPDMDHCPAQWKGGLRAVNLPRFQTDVEQFHIIERPWARIERQSWGISISLAAK